MQLCAILFQCSPNHILTVKLNFHRLIVIQINHADKSIYTFLGQTAYVCFLTCLLFLRYPHNALRFTNHVGEQRNFCKQKCDVPLVFTCSILRYPYNIWHIVSKHCQFLIFSDKLKPHRSERDVEGAVPYNSKHNATQDPTKTKADGFPKQAVPTAAQEKHLPYYFC